MLFIDHLPFHSCLVRIGNDRGRLWSISLPALPSASFPVRVPPRDVQPQRWVLDTGCNTDAFAWRPHLHDAGLDTVDSGEIAGTRTVATAGGSTIDVPVRKASLWLYSNIPFLRGVPFRLALNPGIPFVDADLDKDPEIRVPLIGLMALRRAHLTVKLDFVEDTISVWTPDHWSKDALAFLRRKLPGYSRIDRNWKEWR